MITDAIGQQIDVGGFVFYNGNVYGITKISGKKVHMNYVKGHKLITDKVKYASECCVISADKVDAWMNT